MATSSRGSSQPPPGPREVRLELGVMELSLSADAMRSGQRPRNVSVRIEPPPGVDDGTPSSVLETRALATGSSSAPQLRLLPKEVEQGYNGLASTDHLAIGHNTSLEHFLKVVHTSYEVSSSKTIDTFQYTVSNNHYKDGSSLPSAIFSYDISPMQVLVKEEGKTFAQFLTQICAIIGGVFTVTGLVDAAFFHTSASLRKKMEIGKAH